MISLTFLALVVAASPVPAIVSAHSHSPAVSASGVTNVNPQSPDGQDFIKVYSLVPNGNVLKVSIVNDSKNGYAAITIDGKTSVGECLYQRVGEVNRAFPGAGPDWSWKPIACSTFQMPAWLVAQYGVPPKVAHDLTNDIKSAPIQVYAFAAPTAVPSALPQPIVAVVPKPNRDMKSRNVPKSKMGGEGTSISSRSSSKQNKVAVPSIAMTSSPLPKVISTAPQQTLPPVRSTPQPKATMSPRPTSVPTPVPTPTPTTAPTPSPMLTDSPTPRPTAVMTPQPTPSPKRSSINPTDKTIVNSLPKIIVAFPHPTPTPNMQDEPKIDMLIPLPMPMAARASRSNGWFILTQKKSPHKIQAHLKKVVSKKRLAVKYNPLKGVWKFGATTNSAESVLLHDYSKFLHTTLRARRQAHNVIDGEHLPLSPTESEMLATPTPVQGLATPKPEPTLMPSQTLSP